MATGRILISVAHPYDESVGLGAVIAKWVDEGIDVYLICATNGDIGTIPDSMKDQFNSVAELHSSELEHVTEILKFKEVFKLSYEDSEMIVSELSQHPDSLLYQWENNSDHVIHDIVRIIRQVRPHVVITFNKFGGFGHPDHIAIQRATVEAFKCADDPHYQVDGLEAYHPQKLYFDVYPKKIIAWIQIWLARFKRENPHHVGPNKDLDLIKIYENIEPIHTQIPITDYFNIWDQAIHCHVSQGGMDVSRKPTWWRRWVYGKQGLTRVYPVPTRNKVDEDNVFAGVVID